MMRRRVLVASCLAGVTMLFVTTLLAARPLDAQGDWRMAASLPAPLGEIMGAVVGDKWYVLGGLDAATRKPAGVVYVYDPASDAWSLNKPMPEPAHHVMVAAVNGKIYVFGGFVSAGGETAESGWKPIESAWEYDPAADSWRSLAQMPTPRGAGWAVALNGKIYVIGGAQSNVRGDPTAAMSPDTPQRVLGTVEEYDPATNQWRARAPMPTPRNHLIAGAIDGDIYAIGGRVGSAQITVADDTDVIEKYDPTEDQWFDVGRAPIHRSGMAGGVFDGKIYVAGGEYQDWEGAKAFWAVQSFDPATGRWQNLPRMRLAHHGFAAAFLGGNLHVVGGGFQSDGMPGVNTKTAVHETLRIGP